MRSRRPLCAIALTLLLSACRAPSPAPAPSPEEEPPLISITVEEGVAILEDLLGTVDEATGNTMSYGYEGTVTLDGVDYYNYRVSWLADDRLSYLTNYLVSTDGLTVQETPEEPPAP